MIGKQIAHYVVEAHLGSGGMGEVYQATDSKLGRSVAIKILPEAFVRDADRVSRFEREARVLASLNHPHIAAIYGLEESGGRNFLVMEFGFRQDTGRQDRSRPITHRRGSDHCNTARHSRNRKVFSHGLNGFNGWAQ